MEDLILIHRKTNKNLQTDWSKFSTCLRQIVFCPHKVEAISSSDNYFDSFEKLNMDSNDEVLKGPTAMAFLIEVLCGLHSPIFGETEVLGQFKKFYEDEVQNCYGTLYQHQKLVQYIFQEVKRLRTQYLTNMGAHSYGSLLRKHLKESMNVTIFGSGQLAQEIAPWLYDHKKVQVLCRDLQKSYIQWQEHANKVNLLTYHKVDFIGEICVIAAPLSDTEILSFFEKQFPQFDIVEISQKIKIYDLRGEENRLTHLWGNVVSLSELFSELQFLQIQNQELLETLKKLIQKNSLEYMLRSEFHPLGWDDLCG